MFIALINTIVDYSVISNILIQIGYNQIHIASPFNNSALYTAITLFQCLEMKYIIIIINILHPVHVQQSTC